MKEMDRVGWGRKTNNRNGKRENQGGKEKRKR